MEGRTVLITGGNRGVGKETALCLAKKGARVILACRDQTVAFKTAKEIAFTTGRPQNVLVKYLDLCSLESVRTLAKDILNSEPRLDALINNAGAHFAKRQLTLDGVERTFSVNHLGHFLLTSLLIPLLKKSVPSRILVLSSQAYLYGHVDFDNLNGEHGYGTVEAYCNTKLCCMLFALELSRRLQGTGITVLTVNPGSIKTNINKTLPRWFLTLNKLCPFLWTTLPKAGAITARLASTDELNSVSGCPFYSAGRVLSTTPQAANVAVARKLWAVSETLSCLHDSLC